MSKFLFTIFDKFLGLTLGLRLHPLYPQLLYHCQ